MVSKKLQKIFDNDPHGLLDTWTITVEMTVFAGDMDKKNVEENAVKLLTDITDGTDIFGFSITDVKRDES